MLKIQSARASLGEVDDNKIPQAEEIDACLESADHNLKLALGYARRHQEDRASGARREEPDDDVSI